MKQTFQVRVEMTNYQGIKIKNKKKKKDSQEEE